MTFVTSCIVADPPQYTDPVTTRPELSAYSAHPSIYQAFVIQTPSPSTPAFSVPVRSEDAGDPLVANFWLDYGTLNQQIIASQAIPPSSYNDTSDREISFRWPSARPERNCHTVSIIVAHLSTVLSTGGDTTGNGVGTDFSHLDSKKAETDAAIITWWVNVNPTADALATGTLIGCPTQQMPPATTP